MKDMKKTYKKPSIKEVNLNSTILLQTGSIGDVTVNPNEDSESMDAKGGIWYWMGEEE